MVQDDDPRFKQLRHRFYRLGKFGPNVLSDMGYVYSCEPDQEACRKALFEIAEAGKLDQMETLIDEQEKEILSRIGHLGDPCQFCGLPLDQVKPGPCPVRKKQVATQ